MAMRKDVILSQKEQRGCSKISYARHDLIRTFHQPVTPTRLHQKYSKAEKAMKHACECRKFLFYRFCIYDYITERDVRSMTRLATRARAHTKPGAENPLAEGTKKLPNLSHLPHLHSPGSLVSTPCASFLLYPQPLCASCPTGNRPSSTACRTACRR